MDWWQAILLGIVQGLTEFLPVSSSGHLMIFKELVGADAEGFLDFTVTVHFATVLATIVVSGSSSRAFSSSSITTRRTTCAKSSSP